MKVAGALFFLNIFGVLGALIPSDTSAHTSGIAALPHSVFSWGSIKHPSQGPSRVFGFYSSGCIQGAKNLKLTGTAHQVMRVSRNRYYGHPELISTIQDIARDSLRGTRDDAETQNAPAPSRDGAPLLIGDLSQPRGGPMSFGHASHQSGIDADIWFWDHPEQLKRELTLRERDELPFVSMLGANGLVDPVKFTEARVHKLRVAARHPKVQRIFVNPAIKMALCSNLRGNDRDWLGKLRPWSGHDSHFHIRLFCPADSPECVGQDAVPATEGCDELQQKLPPSAPEPDSTSLPSNKTFRRVIPQACARVLKLPQAQGLQIFKSVPPIQPKEQ